MNESVEPRGLEAVDHYRIEGAVIEYSLSRLREIGERDRLEAFVLWGGQFEEDRSKFRFGSAIFPYQSAIATSDGLLVTIDGLALHRVNEQLYREDQILAGQAHSHPTDAYHSEVDDSLPGVTILGGISLVVPNFARGGWDDMDQWAWYRLHGHGQWDPIPDKIRIEIV